MKHPISSLRFSVMHARMYVCMLECVCASMPNTKVHVCVCILMINSTFGFPGIFRHIHNYFSPFFRVLIFTTVSVLCVFIYLYMRAIVYGTTFHCTIFVVYFLFLFLFLFFFKHYCCYHVKEKENDRKAKNQILATSDYRI